MQVCSTTHLYHYFFNLQEDTLQSVLENGIRPLSDFPESERWKQLEAHMPGFYANLYKMLAEPVLKMPYANSGIFITPIDFRLLPESIMHAKPRFNIPVERLDPRQSVLTYVLAEERVSLPFSDENLQASAALWDADKVTEWFGIDNTKVFFYVPQVAAYQGRIDVSMADYDPGA